MPQSNHRWPVTCALTLLLALAFSCAAPEQKPNSAPPPGPRPATAPKPQAVSAPKPAAAPAAFFPVAAQSGGGPAIFLGGWRGGKWLEEEAGKALARGGEAYRLIGLSGAAGTATGSAVRENEPIGCLEVDLRQSRLKETAVAVGGSWDPQPRQPVLVKSGTGPLLDEAMRLARKKEIQPAGAKIGKVVRVDLDGAGPVTIFEAGNYWEPPHASAADTFSMVGMVRPRSATVEVAGEWYLDQDELPLLTRLVAVADLNGDGTMEIVVSHTYYEGESYTVFEMQAGRPVAVLNYGCGL